MNLRDLPPQPDEDRWHFREDLKAPMWTCHHWGPVRPSTDRADLSAGVRLAAGFPDPAGRLDTAYEDLRRFLAAGSVMERSGAYPIETSPSPDLPPEACRLEIGPASCRLLAADTEGIRRGIFHLEDLMLRARGPVLPLGKLERRPFIQRRISRCFFGPIKRPPRMRDELMDEEDYYPPEYLNRLAHEGVNGLWLTVEFRDLCATTVTPDAGRDAERRLTKLRRTVDACGRYGIRTYIFCIEPRAWDADRPVPAAHPELAGSTSYGGRQCFCPCTDTARSYLYESTNTIFAAVPELGGLINITHGERPTTCLSAISATGEGHIDCPRCARMEPWEILHASLSAMERGMHDAAPEAELISWLYMPQARGAYREGLADWVYQIPDHTPEGVILQFNLETGVRRTEFGKELTGGDYWLSTPGPSSRFERVAEAARPSRTPVSAKIQTGCSHELATVPFLPVPSLLYRKFAGMRRLGVSHTMLCWYFGNYPGLMNKAAGLLSFEPFPDSEDSFLQQLAAVTWGERHAAAVATAWRCFAEGYEHYPLTNLFQYYGPMHDGPVWPLLLEPEDAPLAPTWLLASTVTREPWPPSGDRIGECFMETLTLPEVVELARRMSSAWDRGVHILNGLGDEYADQPERLLDIGVARALGIQLRSGYNILRFYQFREEMLPGKGAERLEQLAALSDIIAEELVLDERLLVLCQADSRLGFHSEAEGYRYYPERIRWRMQQLRDVLAHDVPRFDELIRKGELLFPEYTGMRPTGPVARCTVDDGSLWTRPGRDPPADLCWQGCACGSGPSPVRWAATCDGQALFVVVCAPMVDTLEPEPAPATRVLVKLEPRRLWPCKHFLFCPGETPRAEQPDQVSPQSVEGRVQDSDGVRRIVVRIPLDRMGLCRDRLDPVRLDVRVTLGRLGTRAWRPDNALTPRLRLGTDNPSDLGWLVFDAQPP